MIVQKTTNHVDGLWHHMAPIFKPGLLMPLLQVTVRSLCHSRGVTADYLKFQERFQMKKALVIGGRTVVKKDPDPWAWFCFQGHICKPQVFVGHIPMT